jgi:hypothetical protein
MSSPLVKCYIGYLNVNYYYATHFRPPERIVGWVWIVQLVKYLTYAAGGTISRLRICVKALRAI